MLEVGDRFPVERLSVQPGGPAVVYFYPAALTPGCTMESKGFSDRYERFRAAGYEVIGVSTDQGEKNDEFRTTCHLAFPIHSDEDAGLTSDVGLLKDYGEYGWLARRVTFLLDADGVVRQIWDVTDAGAHPDEVLAMVTVGE
jgi:thioredoxin-dependent peroxiredoxin